MSRGFCSDATAQTTDTDVFDPCTAPDVDEGVEETGAGGDPVRALEKLGAGIQDLEKRGGGCGRALARAYVYVGCSLGKLPYVPSSRPSLALGEAGFLWLRKVAARTAFEHAIRLDSRSAQETVAELFKNGVIDQTWQALYVDAQVFQARVKVSGGPGWFVLAAGGFVSLKPLHRTGGPAWGPYVFVGVGQKKGFAFGLGEGAGVNGGIAIGPALRAEPKWGRARVGLVVAYGWRLPTNSVRPERRLSGPAVAVDFRIR